MKANGAPRNKYPSMHKRNLEQPCKLHNKDSLSLNFTLHSSTENISDGGASGRYGFKAAAMLTHGVVHWESQASAAGESESSAMQRRPRLVTCLPVSPLSPVCGATTALAATLFIEMDL
jgi:hypothetical protein